VLFRSVYIGYFFLAVSVFCFATSSVPIKKFETSDGLFYQLCMCIAIWSVGFVVNWIRAFPQIYVLPMLGGFFWCTGNITTVPVIKSIGIGLGTLIANTVAIVLGWANARFGIFGTTPEIPTYTHINYFGVALTAISCIFFLFVKTESMDALTVSERAFLLPRNSAAEFDAQNENNALTETNQASKRLFGIMLALIAGFFYAATYIPYLYVIDNYEHASQNGLDYVFSMYCGILISSLFYLTIYAVFKQNKPFVNPKTILPGLCGGCLWAIANCSLLFANSVLSQAVTFPIAGSLPSAIASFYGLFFFKEITGQRNILILSLGIAITFIGAIFCGISR